MEITLQQLKVEKHPNTDEKIFNTEEKVYTIPYVPSSAFLSYLEIEEEIEDQNSLKPSEIKKYVGLIVKTFGNQFTETEFFEGIPGYRLMQTISEFIHSLNTNPYASPSDFDLLEDEENAEKKAD
ncbi:MAG: hypothetical protein R3267_05905 [Paenisporosarcina sp.]|nr:hypothetical protein [Paenisporosarcina sp.]